MVKISVIIPVYNCEDYITESIRSILNQTLDDIEIIAIDDGSKDNTLNILNDLANDDSRLLVYSQENQGASAARNRAMSMAKGDYIYFFDADDYLVQDGLEKAYSNAVNNDSDIVLFKYDQYQDDSFLQHIDLNIEKEFPGEDFNNFTFNVYDYKKRAFKGPFAPWYKFYKREFLESQDYFEFSPNLNHNDVPFHVKTILKASKISFVPEYLYHYRTDNPNSISNRRLKKYKDIFSIIDIVEDFLKEEGLFEEFKKEFDYFVINRVTFEIRDRPEEYFELAKERLIGIDLNNDLLSKNVRFKAKTILNSDSLDEYGFKMEINSLEKKLKSLSKKNKALTEENNKLKKELNNAKKKNEEILNSKSWKITEPLRKLNK